MMSFSIRIFFLHHNSIIQYHMPTFDITFEKLNFWKGSKRPTEQKEAL